MNWYNPFIVTDSTQLASMTDHDVLVAIYQFIVSSTLIAFGFFIFYIVFKFLVWVLPSSWYLPKDRK